MTMSIGKNFNENCIKVCDISAPTALFLFPATVTTLSHPPLAAAFAVATLTSTAVTLVAGSLAFLTRKSSGPQ